MRGRSRTTGLRFLSAIQGFGLVRDGLPKEGSGGPAVVLFRRREQRLRKAKETKEAKKDDKPKPDTSQKKHKKD